jgi:hypothetical protein
MKKLLVTLTLSVSFCGLFSMHHNWREAMGVPQYASFEPQGVSGNIHWNGAPGVSGTYIDGDNRYDVYADMNKNVYAGYTKRSNKCTLI